MVHSFYLPLSLSALFYGYFKLLKATGKLKERSSNKDLRSLLGIELRTFHAESCTVAKCQVHSTNLLHFISSLFQRQWYDNIEDFMIVTLYS